MASMRIFVCHDVNVNEEQRDAQVLHQLINRLEEAGAGVLTYPGRAADEGFLPFLYQVLPTCQWFILFETPAAVQLPQVQTAINTTLKLVEQKHLQGALRFIVTPAEQQDLPPAWSAVPSFDATYDYPRAQEKLLLALSLSKANADAIKEEKLPPPPSNPVPSPAYDRPPEPSRLSKLKTSLQSKRGRLVTILTILLVILLLAAVLSSFAPRPSSVAKKPSPVPAPVTKLYGYIYFSSTGATGTNNLTGICDGVTVDLQRLKPPASGNAYYAWLLPDRNNPSGPTLLIHQFTPDANGTANFSYASSNHANLLATDSRFLITEESASNPPQAPTTNKSMWRYYAQLPEAPTPNDPNHFSDLDLLRHLLVDNPSMDLLKLPLRGGLDIWFFQNTRKILEWASTSIAATTTPPNADLTHRNLIRILDALDGTAFVHLDVPVGTGILADR
ncbi:MAG TPA: hypothetical protein VKP04_09485, partial [Ktedonobacteraceae bacterium]|nr:hypothetical protein [Ktedonobacteraceae bacterium]